jgi:hypothetical protein
MLQSKFYLPKLAASSLFLGSLLALGSTMTAAQVAQAKPTQGTVTTVDAQNRRNLGNSATIGTLEVAPEVKSELEAAPTVPLSCLTATKILCSGPCATWVAIVLRWANLALAISELTVALGLSVPICRYRLLCSQAEVRPAATAPQPALIEITGVVLSAPVTAPDF